MDPFLPSFGNSYIFVVVDYVPKWLETIALPTNDVRVVTKFIHKNIFTRFGTPWVIINDEGTHFCDKLFGNLLAKYGMKFKIATAYHPHTSGQVEL